MSVVIPALNEESNLPLVLEGLPDVHEVIVVDGGSNDDTVAVAREVRPDAVIVRQSRSGKGNALVCGFAACTGDIVVTLNANGTTDPGEIPRYVDALLAGAEAAHGSRYRDGGGNLDEHRLDRLGARTLNGLVNALFGTRFTDLGYGYNAYWRTLLPVLELPAARLPDQPRGRRIWGDGPEIEPLINIRMAAQGLRVVEVASIGYPRIYGVGERRPVHECVRALRTTLTEYLRRWRIARHTERHAQKSAPNVIADTRTAAQGAVRRQPVTGVGRGARRRGRAAGSPHPDESFGTFLPPDEPPAGRHAAHRAVPVDSPDHDRYRRDARDQGTRHVADRYAALRPVDHHGHTAAEPPVRHTATPATAAWEPDGLDPDAWDTGMQDPGIRDRGTPPSGLPEPDRSRRHRHREEPEQRQGGWTHAPNPRQQPPWSRPPEPSPLDKQGWRDTDAHPAPGVPGTREPVRHDDPLERADPRQHADRRGASERRTPAQRRSAHRWHTEQAGPPPSTWHLPAPFEPIAQRPDLTVIAGEGRAWQADADRSGHGNRGAHLRAVPGESYGRPGHRA